MMEFTLLNSLMNEAWNIVERDVWAVMNVGVILLFLLLLLLLLFFILRFFVSKVSCDESDYCFNKSNPIPLCVCTSTCADIPKSCIYHRSMCHWL